MRSSRFLLASLLWAAAGAASAEALTIQRVTPEGEDVKDTRQIVIAFDRAVVPLGRMEREASEVPVTITPAVRCDWRWLDPQLLACNLPAEEKLRLATRYEIDIRPEFENDQGERLERGLRVHFLTERPQLRYSRISRWDGPGEPVFYARFSQPVTAESVAASFRVGGVALRPVADPDDREMPFWTPRGEAREQWLLRPARALPTDRAQRLWLSPGLESVFGTATAVDDREALAFHTFPELRLLGISCLRNTAEGVEPEWGLALPGQSCDPLAGAALAFSVPVATTEVKTRLALDPDPRKAFKKDYDPWANSDDGVPSPGAHEQGSNYSVSLPFNFVGGTAYQGELAAGIKDIFGRELRKTGFAFRTGDRTPRMVFEHERAVIESGIDSEVPTIVTNLRAINASFDRMTAAGVQAGQSRSVPVTNVRNIAFAMPLDVRGMIGAGSGAVVGGLLTQPSAETEPRRFFAEVTPWQVHAKLGNSNLLVWVTGMADGKPVARAQVSVIDGFQGAAKATATTDKDGLAELPGAAQLDPKL
ncbi:MAG TPA: hypothetical protein VLI06_16930, partial [Solimonas sp.]|nr:hypothetical protein [Solimonas sp.]